MRSMALMAQGFSETLRFINLRFFKTSMEETSLILFLPKSSIFNLSKSLKELGMDVILF